MGGAGTQLSARERAFLIALYGNRRRNSASDAIREIGYTGARANQAAYKMLHRPRVLRVANMVEAERLRVAEAKEARRRDEHKNWMRRETKELSKSRFYIPQPGDTDW